MGFFTWSLRCRKSRRKTASAGRDRRRRSHNSPRSQPVELKIKGFDENVGY